MSDAELGRLRWRCRRGMKELDHLLVAWLDRHWAASSSDQQAAFERLLAAEDTSLWRWFTGLDQATDAGERALIEAIRTDVAV